MKATIGGPWINEPGRLRAAEEEERWLKKTRGSGGELMYGHIHPPFPDGMYEAVLSTWTPDVADDAETDWNGFGTTPAAAMLDAWDSRTSSLLTAT
jgi:hypothetical protein